MVFKEEYAGAYDNLYQDKDYEKECDFIEALFKKCAYTPKTILDLGCGTGGHALILAVRGYKVTGIDRSAAMLAIARQKAKEAGIEIEFIEGDITSSTLNKTFDAVISMFAVMSYQTTNSAIASVCKLAKESLNPGGLFMFDCWNGLAALSDKPTPRMKEIHLANGGEIIRFTQPEIDSINHVVKVNFRVWRVSPACNPEPCPELVSQVNSGSQVRETFETHLMRFIFPQEIKYFLEVAGFEDVTFCPFLATDSPLKESDWNMMVVGRLS